MILDWAGRPIKPARLRQELAGPSTAAIRPIVSGQHVRGLTPGRMASILREAEDGYAHSYLDLAEEMEERDLHYLAVLGTRRRQVSQLTVEVEPADDSAAAMHDADLVSAWIGRQEIEDELFDLLDAVGKGFSVCEIMWDKSALQWMPARLEYRLPRWFIHDRETGQRLMYRDPAGDHHGWADLEPGKFVVHQHQAKSGTPIRGGLARPIAWVWMFKNYTVRDWVRFVEAYGQPLRLGKYDKSSTEPERDALLRAVTEIAADAAAIIPAGMDIEFVTALPGAARSEVYSSLLEYFDSQVSKAVLGQTLTTDGGQGGSGSYALGRVHNEVRHDIESSDARQLAATLSRDVTRPLVLLNNGDPGARGFPKIALRREKQYDLNLLATVLKELVPLGLRVSMAEVRGKFGLGAPMDDEEVLEPAAMPPTPAGSPPGTDDTGTDTARARGRSERRERDAITRAIGDLLDDGGWEPLMEPVLRPILDAAGAALDRGESLAAFQERLPGIFRDMDSSRLTEVLRRMGFSAALSGAAGLDDGGTDAPSDP